MDDHLPISPLVDWAECQADGFPLLFFRQTANPSSQEGRSGGIQATMKEVPDI